ncbi:MAG TPA: UvrD-helicase domain-containing protein [Acidimicrobiales bacterium]|nr:UvrD-helicase domain-containing protein [Acidimicrobiales bacterium]
MTAPGVTPFDVTGALPSGILSIEASAGTGKTSALAALATRLIAEGRAVASELLIVTFTRAATGELRSRVRHQLIDAADCLAGTRAVLPDEPLFEHLCSADRQGRLDRLRTAITEFDAATITTIHGFAAQVRGALGASPGVDGDARLVEDTGGLIADACADALAAAAVRGSDGVEGLKLKALRAMTEQVVRRPDVRLIPTEHDQGVAPGDRLFSELVVWAIGEVSERRRRNGTVSFDDLLTQLRGALEGSGSTAVVEALRNRFKVALIDEFQDTDSVQWDIFSKLFASEGVDTTLVLVGDPKQSIYAFRGADIHTYLKAVVGDGGAERRSLGTNWRADGAVVRSLAALCERATFGDRDIPFVAVEAAPRHRRLRIRDTEDRPLPALSLRLAVGERIERTTRARQVQTGSAALAIHEDLAMAVRELLDGALIPTADEHGGPRRVRPSDIAVLVGTGAQAEAVQAALLDHGVAAVMSGGDSVLRSPAADQLRYLLNAMDRPSDVRRVRTYALSWFVGWRAEQVASAPGPELEALQAQLRGWADLLATHSAADVLTRVWVDSGVVPRVLGAPDGDRNLTDLDHLAELLHGSVPGGLISVGGMLAFLDAEPEVDVETEVDGGVTARRIESEDDAVQVMTIWLAKGREFPVVCLPSLWRKTGGGHPVSYMDPDLGDRVVDLTGGRPWPDAASGNHRSALAAEEVMGEQLRLLYVALTRAQHQTVVWWANATGSERTALAHMLFSRVDGVIEPDLYQEKKAVIPPDQDLLAALAPLLARAGDTMEVRAVDGRPTGRADPWADRSGGRVPEPLVFVPFEATPDRSRHRWSFSTIARHSSAETLDPHDGTLADRGADDEQGDGLGVDVDGVGVGAAVDGPVDEDHPTAAEDDGPADRPAAGLPGPLAWLPAGTAFGTLVHEVLEDVDFTAPDLGALVASAVDRRLARRAVDLTPRRGPPDSAADGRTVLLEGLLAAISTPLGPLCGGGSLADLAPGDRLNEMVFELRLGEAGHPAGTRDIGRLVLDHLPAEDPLRPWAGELADGVIDVNLSGHLTGSIDLIMRVRDGRGVDRFVVADYKTNQLTPWGHRPGPGDYHPRHLATAMARHDYPLQALLYSVALHRYLRWRLPDYDPATHLGGAAYLFLRGMTGPRDITGGGHPGVFPWPVPAELVTELSNLLDGRPTSRVDR